MFLSWKQFPIIKVSSVGIASIYELRLFENLLFLHFSCLPRPTSISISGKWKRNNRTRRNTSADIGSDNGHTQKNIYTITRNINSVEGLLFFLSIWVSRLVAFGLLARTSRRSLLSINRESKQSGKLSKLRLGRYSMYSTAAQWRN